MYFCRKCFVEFNNTFVYSIDKDGNRRVLIDLRKDKQSTKGYSDEDLRQILIFVKDKLNKVPSKRDLVSFGYSPNTFSRRFGSYSKAIQSIIYNV